ncbi:MAG: SDR family oxidoreductase [Archangium sp.]
MNDYDFAGKTVLVTGASQGIGEAFVRELAQRGATLILVARSEGKLNAIAASLPAGKAHVIAADLQQRGAAKKLFEAVHSKGLKLDVLINNAGYGLYGRFEELSVEDQLGSIELNVLTLVELTHLFMPEILERKGGVIQVASAAAFQPTPFTSVYGASKAFVLSFGEALWAEYRERGVRVLTLNPGQTETGFFDRAGDLPKQKMATPRDVVLVGLKSFNAGHASVVEGFMNKMLTFSGRLMPRAFVAKTVANMIRPKTKPALAAKNG